MDLNADFSKRVIVHSDNLEWMASPMAGVDRRMLDRIGDEVARATTIVRYAPQSKFSPHVHTGGEEFIVLEGIFQDEHGDYPTGSYIRNPPTSSHTPRSDDGCIIFVKLWQFDMADRTHLNIDMNNMPSIQSKDNSHISIMPLFQDERETVQMQTWDANASIKIDFPHGAECLLLEGSFTDNGDELHKHSWLRIPTGGILNAIAGINGAKIWMKIGHIPFAAAPVI